MTTLNSIGHFGKYHKSFCLSLQILHKLCFQFLLGLTMVPREIKTILMQNLGGQTKSIMVFSEVAYCFCFCFQRNGGKIPGNFPVGNTKAR